MFVYGGTMAWLVPSDDAMSFYTAGVGSEVYVWDGDTIVLTDEFDKDFVIDMLRTKYPNFETITYEGIKVTSLPVVITAIIDGYI